MARNNTVSDRVQVVEPSALTQSPQVAELIKSNMEAMASIHTILEIMRNKQQAQHEEIDKIKQRDNRSQNAEFTVVKARGKNQSKASTIQNQRTEASGNNANMLSEIFQVIASQAREDRKIMRTEFQAQLDERNNQIDDKIVTAFDGVLDPIFERLEAMESSMGKISKTVRKKPPQSELDTPSRFSPERKKAPTGNEWKDTRLNPKEGRVTRSMSQKISNQKKVA